MPRVAFEPIIPMFGHERVFFVARPLIGRVCVVNVKNQMCNVTPHSKLHWPKYFSSICSVTQVTHCGCVCAYVHENVYL
jgi:hypothetical protein